MKQLYEMLSNNKTLELLSMNSCQLGEDGAEWISLGLSYNYTLKSFYIGDNNLGDEGIERLASAMSTCKGFRLEQWDLSKNFVSDKAGSMIIENLAENRSLKFLNFSDNTLGEITAN